MSKRSETKRKEKKSKYTEEIRDQAISSEK